MKLDQLAFYAHNIEQVDEIKARFGLTNAEWVEDFAEGTVRVFGGDEEWSKAHLRFNYDLGIELEIITYLEGPHWHMNKLPFQAGAIFMSHIGFHMDDGERPPAALLTDDRKLVQVMDTVCHTNPYLLERGRRYHYEIYDGRPEHKFIWRREG